MTDLERFVSAQAPVFDAVRRELSAGQKTSHWMWFVFPQIAGLGSSPTARFYALSSLADAKAYLAHPLLGARLAEATGLVLALSEGTAHEIFGSPDDLKFRSSMTLFAAADPADPLFRRALDRFFRGEPDERTLSLLGRG
ncbi:calpastatin [Aureimonas sp. Leaf454]|uniref:DUF1810 domain-containing protein n=1 Tax=Aureimonas sp. Leaf454 TaxID=1736381 RepID=UPI0006F85006|nr:DUF1810 domain-containing protein [Aureimonas sp. Leaf454]KQT50978.1 calpastatin [Aureimonas sp. Leaf454]